MALKSDMKALGSCLKLICEHELQILSNTKASATKDHGENHMKVRSPLVRDLYGVFVLLSSRNPKQKSNNEGGTEMY